MLACLAVGELASSETSPLELRIGRLFFALSVVASGIYQVVTGRYVNLVPVDPARLPPAWQPYAFGVLFVLIGVGLLVRRTVSAAAVTLAVLLLVLFFGFGLPLALKHASTGYVWVDPLMDLALLGGVSLIAARACLQRQRASLHWRWAHSWPTAACCTSRMRNTWPA